VWFKNGFLGTYVAAVTIFGPAAPSDYGIVHSDIGRGLSSFPSLANGLSNGHAKRTICGGYVQGWQQILNGSLPIEETGEKNALLGKGNLVHVDWAFVASYGVPEEHY
jgi:hypothetical protein